MTLYGATDPQVIGQPISPFFGAQQNTRYSGAPVIPAPAQATAPLVSTLEAVGRGAVPTNALVSTINSVNIGGSVANPGVGADPTSVLEMLASGNGNQANGGVGAGAITPEPSEQQEYSVNQTAVANLANGPTPVNVDPLGLAPVQGGIPVNALGLVSQGFIG